jgi:integrase
VVARDSWPRTLGKSHQSRPLREACASAHIVPAASFHVLRHTYASRLAMRGVPMAVIAQQLGHADTRMTERHYAHLAPSYVAEMVRAGFGALGVVRTGDLAVLPLATRTLRRSS